ncbi:hypothetical protein CSA56_12260 [candidate division KSB3 bacterium]|uniref:Uncharacterized protein n=1 Tax=candidate division KSB3 bacterium TaxID=2044937 RepID=A0A2G6KCF2_9BACT|nr:MAG: hypothetical protein CSA56_12260 [candidate division KSB3 bacterium]
MDVQALFTDESENMYVHTTFPKGRPLTGRTLLLLTQPSVAILAIMFVFMQWHIPTTVRVSVTYEAEDIEHVDSIIDSMKIGEFPSALIKTFLIHYPDFPKSRPITMTNITRIDVRPAGTLKVEAVGQDIHQQEMRFQFDGIVELFRVRTATKNRDLLLTRFDRLLHSQKALLGLLMLWLVFTGIGWFKVYKGLLKS